MTVPIKELKARREAAQQEFDTFEPLRRDCYDYVIPYRRSVRSTGKGEERVNRAFDHTAITSAFRGAGRIAQDISPPGVPFYALAPGRLSKIVMPAREIETLRLTLETTTAITAAHFQTGEWDQALAEMALDLEAGTGFMLIVPDKRRRMARFVSVAADEVMLTSDGYGSVDGIYWSRKWPLYSLKRELDGMHLGRELEDRLKAKPHDEIDVYQDTVFNPDPKGERGPWCRVMWAKEFSETLALEETYSYAGPWLTPRYFRVPGESYGRGPIMLVMPTIRSLNVAMKINLQAAAIAMLGIYTAIDDGVFSPDNAPLTPGAFWKVARNGGALGPSVQRFPDPRIDMNQIVLNELRMAVQGGMNDQQLPPDGAAVRSATEIIERIKRLASDHNGAWGRMVMEIAVPAVQRVIEIAYDFQQIQYAPGLDRLLVDIDVSSPIAQARQADNMQRVGQYIELANAIAGPVGKNPLRYYNPDAVMPEFQSALQVPSAMVPSEDERNAMDDQEAAMTAAAAAVALAGGAAQQTQQKPALKAVA